MRSEHTEVAVPGVFADRAQELYALLEKNCFLYTMGESTTLREDVARELTLGIQYCVELHLKLCPADAAAPLATLYEAGIEDATKLAKRGRLLLSDAVRRAPAAANAPYAETLKALSSFFALYDARLFAHAVPCELVYPLCRPVDERVMGAEYILAYLRELNAEADLLRCFDQRSLAALLRGGLGDYEELVLNICAPVVENALGCVLLDADPVYPGMDEADRARLFDMLAFGGVRAPLERAAERLCAALRLSTTQTELVEHIAHELAPRLEAALGANDKNGAFSGIFFTPASF